MEEGKRSELPMDIILEVLLRLPAKALCRFRFVCKAWRAVIADPTFVAAQRSRTGPHLVGVFFGDCMWPPKVRVMDMDGNVVRKLEVRVSGKGDDNILGVLRQATATRIDLICALRCSTIVAGDSHVVIVIDNPTHLTPAPWP